MEVRKHVHPSNGHDPYLPTHCAGLRAAPRRMRPAAQSRLQDLESPSTHLLYDLVLPPLARGSPALGFWAWPSSQQPVLGRWSATGPHSLGRGTPHAAGHTGCPRERREHPGLAGGRLCGDERVGCPWFHRRMGLARVNHPGARQRTEGAPWGSGPHGWCLDGEGCPLGNLPHRRLRRGLRG